MEMENLNRFSEIYRVVLQINPILSGSFSEEYGDDGGDDYKMVMMMNMLTITVVMVMLPMQWYVCILCCNYWQNIHDHIVRVVMKMKLVMMMIKMLVMVVM